MTSARVSKIELELREHLDKTLRENSLANEKYVKAKYAHSWMEENQYLIPEKLNQDLNVLKKEVDKLDNEINRLIAEIDGIRDFPLKRTKKTSAKDFPASFTDSGDY